MTPREVLTDISGSDPKMPSTDAVNDASINVIMLCYVDDVRLRSVLDSMKKILSEWNMEDS